MIDNLTSATVWRLNVTNEGDYNTQTRTVLDLFVEQMNNQCYPPAVRISSRRYAATAKLTSSQVTKILNGLVTEGVLMDKGDNSYAFGRPDAEPRSATRRQPPAPKQIDKPTDKPTITITFDSLIEKYGIDVVQQAYDAAKAQNKHFNIKYVAAAAERMAGVKRDLEQQSTQSDVRTDAGGELETRESDYAD